METSVASPLMGVRDTDSSRGGWATSVYLIVAEVMERFANYGSTGNLITYLTNVLHESTATAAKNVNVFSGISTLLPLLGAFAADSYLGRYKTILISSLIYVTGLFLLTLSAWIIPLEFRHVPFFLSLYLLGIGVGGHKPCLQTFGADQFNENNHEEKKAKSTFFNWWYFGVCFGASAGILVVFFIEENVGWVPGYAIPAAAMAVGLIIFLLGRKSYWKHIPQGSPLTRIMQVFIAAIRKQHLRVSKKDNAVCIEEGDDVANGVPMLPSTSQFKCLDKAMIIDEMDTMDLTRNNWRLCTVTQVEEVKLLLRLLPIWLTSLMYGVVWAQGGTFFTKQGSTMDTSVGKGFHVPPASLLVFVGLSVLIIVPIYDKVFVPIARRFTGHRSGITMLQRIGLGMFSSTISIVVAALIERRRIKVASEHGLLDQPTKTVPMTVWWLLPQYLISGASDVFTIVGLQELFYDQMPNEMRSIGSALQLSVFGFGSLLSSAVISIVQYASARTGDEWLVNNLNRAHLDYYYWLLAGLCMCGLCAFLVVANNFAYKKVDGDYDAPAV